MAAADPISVKQLNFIRDLVRDRELGDDLARYVEANPPESLTRGAASALIDELLARPKVEARSEATPATVATRRVPDGTYTVDMGDGSWVTLQIAPATWADGDDLRQVSFLEGPDNELAYRGFAFLKADGRVVVWRRFREGHGRQRAALELLLTGDVAEAHRRFLDRAEAYALASGSCMRCGRTLTVPASLHRGLGPVCAQRETATAEEIAGTPRFEGEPIARRVSQACEDGEHGGRCHGCGCGCHSQATTVAQRELPF